MYVYIYIYIYVCRILNPAMPRIRTSSVSLRSADRVTRPVCAGKRVAPGSVRVRWVRRGGCPSPPGRHAANDQKQSHQAAQRLPCAHDAPKHCFLTKTLFHPHKQLLP